MVATEDQFHVSAEELNGLFEPSRPVLSAPNLSAPQGIEIMEYGIGLFGGAEGFPLGEIEHHFRRSLGIRGVHEDHLHAVNRNGRGGLSDNVRRRDHGHPAIGGGLPQSRIDPAPGTRFQ